MIVRSFAVGKREVLDEDWRFGDYFNLEDERDRRGIDEEDDENFLQELDLLAQEVEEETARSRYKNDHQISRRWRKLIM